ncbi:MAG: hypothetical protein L0191_01055, partial [Acidobacteria bacterium]|nr:hypothetical protein [Acidobacteriota bacterium]
DSVRIPRGGEPPEGGGDGDIDISVDPPHLDRRDRHRGGAARGLAGAARPGCAWCEAREGAYLLRRNLTEANSARLWMQYVQLTEAEAAFRTLKSELAMWPIWHQKASRVLAHILVAFLGYAL